VTLAIPGYHKVVAAVILLLQGVPIQLIATKGLSGPVFRLTDSQANINILTGNHNPMVMDTIHLILRNSNRSNNKVSLGDRHPTHL